MPALNIKNNKHLAVIFTFMWFVKFEETKISSYKYHT